MGRQSITFDYATGGFTATPSVSATDIALAGIALGLTQEQTVELEAKLRKTNPPKSAGQAYEHLIKLAYEIKQEKNE